MAFALSLLFDAEIADALSARWQRLADAGLSRSMLDLGYPPHVTLAVYDHADTKLAAEALDSVFAQASRVEVTLAGISTFGPGSGVCYIALSPSPDLHRLHQSALAAVGQSCRPHYQDGRWTPHCTLATNLSDAALVQSRELVAQDWLPLTGTFEIADLVEFAPIFGVKRWALRSHSTRTP